MIQSGKFDSLYMNIKKLGNSILIFAIKRLLEIIGLIIFSSGILLFIALISYSPSDPNFIFPNNTQIKNIFGFRGSFISDIFMQSVGLICYLVPITYIFTGLNIFRKKEIFLFLENTFFIILYCIIGAAFFNFYHENTFTLFINGNGGFIGSYLNENFLNDIITSYKNIFYYLFTTLITIFFLISINFNIKEFFRFIKKVSKFFFKKDDKNYTSKDELIDQYIPQDEIKI